MTLKLLVSGNTTQQIGRGTRLKYGAVIDLFVAALRDAGVEIDHRVIEPGESLDGYDALWLGMSPVNAISARYTFGPLDAYQRAVAEGKPVVFWIDDWQTQLLNSSFKTFLNKPWRMVKEPGHAVQDSRYGIEWARRPENLDRLVKGLDLLKNSPWPQTVAPFYTWGEHLQIFKKHPQVTAENLVAVDPSRYVEFYPIHPAPDEQRKRQWVFGILSNQLEWLESVGLHGPRKTDARWDIAHAGGRASKADGSLKEPDLVQLYSECWGVLSAPYWHAGSGWWRNRFVYAAYAGSVLAGDPREGYACDPSYGYPPDVVETFTTSQLRELADAQKTALLSKMPSKEYVQQQLLDVFAKAIEEKK